MKREEAYSAFSSHKQILDEGKKRRAGAIISSAKRILKGVINRAETFKSVDDVNAYFASALMVTKLRENIKKLHDMGNSVEGDDLTGQLKSAKDEIIRRLRDKLELFDEGDKIIKFNDYKFTVNTQPLELSMIFRDNTMFFHLSGTDFLEKVEDDEFLETKDLWDQELVSESQTVYRSEYLAYQMLMAAVSNDKGLSIKSLTETADEVNNLEQMVREFSSGLYSEGYEKGVHDHDATLILKALVQTYNNCELLRYDSDSRAHAILFWRFCSNNEIKKRLRNKLRSFGAISHVFGQNDVNRLYIEEIRVEIETFYTNLDRNLEPAVLSQASEYLYYELQDSDKLVFTINAIAYDLYTRFMKYLKKKKMDVGFLKDIQTLEGHIKSQLNLAEDWISTYIRTREDREANYFVWEVIALFLASDVIDSEAHSTSTFTQIDGLLGQHPIINDQTLPLHFDQYLLKMKQFVDVQVPLFNKYLHLKNELTEKRRQEMRLSEFLPKVMGSFVRNKLINDVYLNLVGANFAKQMGVAGENKRTDLMGLLLLISPPGYGKTTLMEYLANRLGLTFMKINGPAIGHNVTSLDPVEAPNATARVELNKLNLSLVMGNNVMIYLDDIQHLNPEFLQKFISLCDAQRKIEGIYRGVTKTYDLRGKKVSVVMAGNPYTESGDKFKIPDMLANRADTYNLGDISSGSADAFALSFIENAMTSNQVLSKITGHSHADIYRFIEIVERESREGIEFDFDYSDVEITEIVDVLKRLCKVRDVVLKVNQQYIYSAAQQDQYRTEPPFKLQGSYRNMNRMAEKVYPVMSDKEVDELIINHYINEAQTLTSGAESNLLKFKEMIGVLTDDENDRWLQIKNEFNRRQTLSGVDDSDDVGKIIAQLSSFNANVGSIGQVLDKGFNKGLQKILSEFINKTDTPSLDIKTLIDALNELAKDQKHLTITNSIPEEYANALSNQGESLKQIIPILDELKENSKTNVELRNLLQHLMKGSLTVELKD